MWSFHKIYLIRRKKCLSVMLKIMNGTKAAGDCCALGHPAVIRYLKKENSDLLIILKNFVEYIF